MNRNDYKEEKTENVYTDDEIEIVDLDDNKSDEAVKSSKKKKKKKPVIIAAVVTMLLAMVATFSWYLFNKDSHADTKDIKIMTPYFLYLLNPDDKTSLQFSVGNIHPGEVKQVVICVSNKKPDDVSDGSVDIARESKFNYDLEFVHTENLKVNYDIYELQKDSYTDTADIPSNGILVDGVDGVYWTKMETDGNVNPLTPTKDETTSRLNTVFPEGTDGVFNKGKYLLYQYDSNGVQMGLEYKDNGTDKKYEFDYYLVEISWEKNVNFSEYTKETDLLYVIVNAKQPKPVTQSGN
ncbi:hypothetical protein ACTNBM_06715 [Lachnospiraceae bacterium HCP1S3_C3]|nr:hypothetical protein [Lachnospiraceae bacterium]MDD6857816.1 hypothetical protein [Lachnospiraceae bacterium]